jgi:hypothetical protein
MRRQRVSPAPTATVVDGVSASHHSRMPRRRIGILCTTIAASLTLAACGASTEPAPPNIDGNWQMGFSGDADISTGVRVTCSSAGTLSISQSNQTFTGQLSGTDVTCLSTQGDSTEIGTVDGPLVNGRIQIGEMSFAVGACSFFKGLILENNSVFGDARCTLSYRGHSYTFSGTFGLGR